MRAGRGRHAPIVRKAREEGRLQTELVNGPAYHPQAGEPKLGRAVTLLRDPQGVGRGLAGANKADGPLGLVHNGRTRMGRVAYPK